MTCPLESLQQLLLLPPLLKPCTPSPHPRLPFAVSPLLHLPCALPNLCRRPQRTDAVVIVGAEQDAYVSPQSVLELQQHLDGSEVRWAPGGHWGVWGRQSPEPRACLWSSAVSAAQWAGSCSGVAQLPAAPVKPPSQTVPTLPAAPSLGLDSTPASSCPRRWVPGGHVTSFLLHHRVFRNAVVDSLAKLAQPPPLVRSASDAGAQ